MSREQILIRPRCKASPVCVETPGAGKEAGRRYKPPSRKTNGYHPSSSEPPSPISGFILDLGFRSARPDGPDRRAGPSGALESAQRFRGRGREPGRRVSSGAKRRASHDDREENDRPQPPVSDEGGDRRQAGHHRAGGRSVRVFMRARSRLRISPRTGASERSEAAPGAGKGLKKPEGQGSQREASVCRRPGAPNRSGRAERPRVYAVAEPAATPEDRQSERSEVCRNRATEKYKMPEGRACRRVAVVRPAPEAGREPLRGGRARMPSGRRGGAEPGSDGRWHPRGRAGENGVAGGA